MIYECNQVLELIESNSCVLFDIRDDFDYLEEHIPGAVSAPDIFFYLSESTPEGIKRLQSFFVELFSKSGLSKDKTAIIYEYSLDSRYGGSCRGYWLLDYLGHDKVGILNGGFRLWKKSGCPVSKIPVVPEPSDFIPKINESIFAAKFDVISAINNPDIVILDSRDEIEWIGESSSPYGIDFAPRKGKIPGAKWIEWCSFMNSPGEYPTFLKKEEIVTLCAKHDIYPESDIILYCFKGARASNTYLALKYAGFKKIRLYFAGWNEWSRDFSLPIKK